MEIDCNLSRVPGYSHSFSQPTPAPHKLRPQQWQEWNAKLDWIWQPAHVLEAREKPDGVGFMWVAELTEEMLVCVGGDGNGIQFCALLQGIEGLIWDLNNGLCEVQSFSATSPQGAHTFADAMQPLLRRNCFLAGAPIRSTKDERCQWIQWMLHRITKPTSQSYPPPNHQSVSIE